ncbi:hypothetical protein K2X33_15250 [bacterium]|nr:hypothetical protein [bacterium]
MRVLLLATLVACGALQAKPEQLSADKFLEQTLSGGVAEGTQVEILFHPGKRGAVPDSLQRVMVGLASAGVEVTGRLVNEADYVQALEDAGDEGVYYELRDFEAPRKAGILQRIAEALGIPAGVGSYRVEPLKPLRRFSEQERGIFLETLAIHNFVMLTGLTLARNFTLAPAVVLSTYFYQTFANISETLRFKGAGHIATRRGDQIGTEVNPYFLLLVNIAEELAINSAVAATIPSEGGLPYSKILRMSGLVGLAKSAVDRFGASLELRRQKALKVGDKELAETLERQRFRVMRRFFNGVVPVVRAFALVTERVLEMPVCAAIEGAAFAALGCQTIVQEFRRMGRLRTVPEEFQSESCPGALVRVSIGAR